MAKLLKFNDLDYVHFVTTNTWRKISYFKDKNNCLILLNNILFYQVKHNYKVLAYCIMPDHLHLLIGHYLFKINEVNLDADGINPSANHYSKTNPSANHYSKTNPSANHYSKTNPSANHYSKTNPSANQKKKNNSPQLYNRFTQNKQITSSRLDDGFTQNKQITSPRLDDGFTQNKQITSPRLDDGFTQNKQITSPRLDDGFTQNKQITSPRLDDGFTPSSIENIIHDIKGKTAVDIRNILKIKNKIWQKSFYDFPIYSQHKLEEKIDYIHNNPVKAGLVNNMEDYPWSGFFIN